MPATFPRAHRSAPWVAIALAGALLAGCSSDTSPGEGGAPPPASELPPCPVGALKDATGPVEVVIWYHLSGDTKDTLLSQIEKYNASQSKVKVRAETQGADYDELFAAYKRAIPSKTNLPDLLISDETATRYLVDSGTVLAGQKCFEADGLSTSEFNQAAVNYYTVGDVMYPVSMSLSNILTYYNKAHFSQAGLDPNKPPGTLAEVRQYAQKLKDAGVTEKPVVMKLAPWFLETQLTGAHQSLVDNDNGHGPGRTTKATFDTDTTRQVYDWIKSMTADGLLNPKADSPGMFDHLLATAQGSSSMMLETSTLAVSAASFLGGDTSTADEVGVDTGNVRVTQADVGAGPVFGVSAPGKAQIGGNAFYITSTSPPVEQSAAWDFAKWWNQPEQQTTWNIKGSYLPFLTSTAQDPAIQAFWRDTFAGRILKVGYDQLASIDPKFPGPALGPYQETRTILRASLDRVALPGSDPDAIITGAVSEVDTAIKTYNEGL